MQAKHKKILISVLYFGQILYAFTISASKISSPTSTVVAKRAERRSAAQDQKILLANSKANSIKKESPSQGVVGDYINILTALGYKPNFFDEYKIAWAKKWDHDPSLEVSNHPIANISEDEKKQIQEDGWFIALLERYEKPTFSFELQKKSLEQFKADIEALQELLPKKENQNLTAYIARIIAVCKKVYMDIESNIELDIQENKDKQVEVKMDTILKEYYALGLPVEECIQIAKDTESTLTSHETLLKEVYPQVITALKQIDFEIKQLKRKHHKSLAGALKEAQLGLEKIQKIIHKDTTQKDAFARQQYIVNQLQIALHNEEEENKEVAKQAEKVEAEIKRILRGEALTDYEQALQSVQDEINRLELEIDSYQFKTGNYYETKKKSAETNLSHQQRVLDKLRILEEKARDKVREINRRVDALLERHNNDLESALASLKSKSSRLDNELKDELQSRIKKEKEENSAGSDKVARAKAAYDKATGVDKAVKGREYLLAYALYGLDSALKISGQSFKSLPITTQNDIIARIQKTAYQLENASKSGRFMSTSEKNSMVIKLGEDILSLALGIDPSYVRNRDVVGAGQQMLLNKAAGMLGAQTDQSNSFSF